MIPGHKNHNSRQVGVHMFVCTLFAGVTEKGSKFESEN